MDPWKCAVPVLIPRLDDSNLEEHARAIHALGADTIFLAAPDGMADEPSSLDEFRALRDRLPALIQFFAKHHIASAFWLGRTIGHGEQRVDKARWPFQPLVGPAGEESPGCFCPLDAGFRHYLSQSLAIIAESGIPFIGLDDDYRLVSHGPNTPLACYCPLHLEAFRRKTGLALSREELFRQAMCGQPGVLRSQWLDTLGESLMLLAGDIERAVHAVNPQTRIGICSAMWLTSGHDGVDLAALSRRLAGQTRPFIRTIGAPYWAQEPYHVTWITEYTRLQHSWLRKSCPEAELLAEGDTYPHSRFHTSAAMLLSYKEWLMISGFPGLLCYAVGYLGRPGYEPGYVRRLSASLRRDDNLLKFCPADYRTVGLRPLEEPYSFRHWPMPADPREAAKNWPNQPVSLKLLSRLGIPLTYDSEAGPVFLCGHGAASLSDAELNRALAGGAVLDASAAGWLLQRGFDIGIRSIAPADTPHAERFGQDPLNGPNAGIILPPRASGKRTFHRLEPAPGARVISQFTTGAGEPLFPGTTLYENPAGQRFCILPLDLPDLGAKGTLMLEYTRQEQLTRCLAWVHRRPLPATVNGLADMHVLCRVSPAGDRLVVAVQNAHLDPADAITLRLDPAIRVPARIELFAADSEAPVPCSDFEYTSDAEYGYLTIRSPLPAMGLMAVAISSPEIKDLLK